MPGPTKKSASDHYTGLKVGHGIEDFNVGEEKVLVFEDREILDEEDTDILVNQELEDSRRAEKHADSKRKLASTGANAYDQDSWPASPSKKSALGIYDDEEDEHNHQQRKSTFTLGESAASAASSKKTERHDGVAISLANDEAKKVMSDYQTVDFKKPKRSKTAFQPTARKKILSDDLGGDYSTSISSSSVTDLDQDLELALANARRANIRKQADNEDDATAHIFASNRTESANLVVSAVSEFLRTIRPQDAEKQKEQSIDDAPKTTPQQKPSELQQEDVSVPIKLEATIPNGKRDGPINPLVDEPIVARGMAATLQLLNQRGAFQPPKPEDRKNELVQRERRQMQLQQNKLESAVEKERVPGKKSSSSTPASVELDRWRRAKEKMLETYHPDVKIEYTDHFGRQLNVKDAWKQMCHRFHGMNPGKKKLEKLLKKVEDEKKVQSPYETAAALEQQTKELGSAYISLSGPTTSASAKPAKGSSYFPKMKSFALGTASVVNMVPRNLAKKGTIPKGATRAPVGDVPEKVKFELNK